MIMTGHPLLLANAHKLVVWFAYDHEDKVLAVFRSYAEAHAARVPDGGVSLRLVEPDKPALIGGRWFVVTQATIEEISQPVLDYFGNVVPPEAAEDTG